MCYFHLLQFEFSRVPQSVVKTAKILKQHMTFYATRQLESVADYFEISNKNMFMHSHFAMTVDFHDENINMALFEISKYFLSETDSSRVL